MADLQYGGAPVSLLSNISFAGMFSATSLPREAPYQAESDANISILDSAYLGASDIGKFGVNSKIDASKYTVFAVRMYITPPINNWPTGQLFWSRNTMYEDYTTSNAFMIHGGWCIYLLNLPALGDVNTPSTTPTPWSGFKESLRFDPTTQPGKNIQIDWIRLVQNGAEFRKTITWTGSGDVDIYLDNDQNRETEISAFWPRSNRGILRIRDRRIGRRQLLHGHRSDWDLNVLLFDGILCRDRTADYSDHEALGRRQRSGFHDRRRAQSLGF